MIELWKEYGKGIRNYIMIAMVFIFIYVFFTFIIPFFLPFFVGMIIAAVNAPFVRIFEKNLKIKRPIAVAISMFLTISLLAMLLISSALNIYNELVKLQSNMPVYYDSTFNNLKGLYDKAMNLYNHLPSNVSDSINQNLVGLKDRSEVLLEKLISGMMSTVSSIPRMIVFSVVSLLSAFFINSDSRRLKIFFSKQIPKELHKSLEGFRADALRAFVGYIKAVFILMGITCFLVTVGLFIMGADYAILMGLIVGLSEAIPLFGTGIVMIPWILWNLIAGNNSMALGLFIIFILGVVVRQILEPKIVGDKMGLHPLATLAAMYLGTEIFGFAGLFIGPLSLIILKSIQKSGLVKIWKD